jgi:hypothetical protein
MPGNITSGKASGQDRKPIEISTAPKTILSGLLGQLPLLSGDVFGKQTKDQDPKTKDATLTKKATEAEIKAEAERKKQEERQDAIGIIAVRILFRNQKNTNKTIAESYELEQSDDEFHKKTKEARLEYGITRQEIIDEVKKIANAEGNYSRSMYISSLNQKHNSGGFSASQLTHDQQTKTHKKLIKSYVENNISLDTVAKNIIGNFRIVEGIFDDGQSISSQSSESSTPLIQSSTTSQPNVLKKISNFISSKFSSIISSENSTKKNNSDDKIIPDAQSPDSGSSTSSQDASSTSESYQSSDSESSKKSTFKTVLDLIRGSKKDENESQSTSYSKVTGDAGRKNREIPKELVGIIADIKKSLKSENDKRITYHTDQVNSTQEELKKLEKAREEEAKSQEQRLELARNNQKLKKLQEKATADLSKKIEEQLNKSTSVQKQGETVLTLTMKDKKTGETSSVQISAKDVKLLAKKVAGTIMGTVETSVEMGKIGTNAMSIETLKDLGQGTLKTLSTCPSGPPLTENLANMAVFITSNRGGNIDITKSVISTAKFFGQGLQEIPGALKSIATSAAVNAPSATAGCLSGFVEKLQVASNKTFSASVSRSRR